MGNRIYGCDDCLAVCPWNKFAQAHSEPAFAPRAELDAPRLAELATLDDAAFRALFSGSPVKRIGRDRFVRNVLVAIGNSADPALRAAAQAHARRPEPGGRRRRALGGRKARPGMTTPATKARSCCSAAGRIPRPAWPGRSDRFARVETVGFAYGQRHRVELDCAERLPRPPPRAVPRLGGTPRRGAHPAARRARRPVATPP